MYKTNIYQNARVSAGLTQERAAEKLGISVESIKAYETYRRLPPFDIVDGMALIYRADYLPYQHMRIASGEVKVIPEVEVRSLEQAAMSLINKTLAFADKRRDRDLLAIAEDGVIDEAERPLFEAIVAELDELIKAALELKVSKGAEP